MARELKGWHVATIFCGAFAVIIAANLTLAYNAVQTFPGLEVKNSYVASQHFDADRAAQERLNWTTQVRFEDGVVRLRFTDDTGASIRVGMLDATIGRATHVSDDRALDWRWSGTDYTADAELASGNWNLRLNATAEDGTPFRQRVALWVPRTK